MKPFTNPSPRPNTITFSMLIVNECRSSVVFFVNTYTSKSIYVYIYTHTKLQDACGRFRVKGLSVSGF